VGAETPGVAGAPTYPAHTPCTTSYVSEVVDPSSVCRVT
jgi:hypothetical protein